MSNILDWSESIRSDGTVTQAFANRKSAIIHDADIAAVAAAALTTVTLRRVYLLRYLSRYRIIG